MDILLFITVINILVQCFKKIKIVLVGCNKNHDNCTLLGN